jgi:hypothetical protein
MGKRYEHFTKRYLPVGNKPMERCLMSSDSREMQVKATTGYIPRRMVYVRKNEHRKG